MARYTHITENPALRSLIVSLDTNSIYLSLDQAIADGENVDNLKEVPGKLKDGERPFYADGPNDPSVILPDVDTAIKWIRKRGHQAGPQLIAMTVRA